MRKLLCLLLAVIGCGGDADSTDAGGTQVPNPPSSVTCGDINVIDNSNGEEPVEPETPVDDSDDGLQCDIENEPCIGNPAVSRAMLRAVKGFMLEHDLVQFTIQEITPVSAKSTVVAGCGSTVVIDNSTTNVTTYVVSPSGSEN